MTEPEHPFIDNGTGYPTAGSVCTALGMFSLDKLADAPISFRGEEGTMVDLIARCKIEHLTKDWPKGFIAKVIGSATEASRQS